MTRPIVWPKASTAITEAAGNKTSDRNAMERLFNFVKMNDRDVDRLHRLGCLTTSTFAHPSLDGDVADTDFLRRTMRHRRVARLIKRTSGELHIFFMSDLENDNVVVADMLSADKTIHDFLENGDKTQRATFYCHARYNSVHRVIEDRQYHERLQVKVIDSSRLTAGSGARPIRCGAHRSAAMWWIAAWPTWPGVLWPMRPLWRRPCPSCPGSRWHGRASPCT